MNTPAKTQQMLPRVLSERSIASIPAGARHTAAWQHPGADLRCQYADRAAADGAADHSTARPIAARDHHSDPADLPELAQAWSYIQMTELNTLSHSGKCCPSSTPRSCPNWCRQKAVSSRLLCIQGSSADDRSQQELARAVRLHA